MKQSRQAGKGSKPRPVNGDRYRQNYTAIDFSSRRADRERMGRVVKGREYLGEGSWCHAEWREKQLRD